MKTVIEFFKKKWVIQLLGIIALSLLIWFVGPLIAVAGHVPLESDTLRWVVILAIVVVWAVRVRPLLVQSVVCSASHAIRFACNWRIMQYSALFMDYVDNTLLMLADYNLVATSISISDQQGQSPARLARD